MRGLILSDQSTPFMNKGINFDSLLKKQTPISKIILSTEYEKRISRKDLIENFLKNGCLTQKQSIGMKPWLEDLLNDFAIEVLLHAKHGDIDQLLSGTNSAIRHKKESSFPLALVAHKPKKMKITLDEIEGDLDSDVKLISLKDVPLKSEERYNGCD